jgi:hypothetical protein
LDSQKSESPNVATRLNELLLMMILQKERPLELSAMLQMFRVNASSNDATPSASTEQTLSGAISTAPFDTEPAQSTTETAREHHCGVPLFTVEDERKIWGRQFGIDPDDMCVLDLWKASNNLQFPSNAKEIGYITFNAFIPDFQTRRRDPSRMIPRLRKTTLGLSSYCS